MKCKLILWVAVLYSTVAVAYQSEPISSVVHFRVLHDFVVVVPIYIEGRGPYDFVLDTGTTSCVIDPSLAAAIALQPKDAVELMTIAGTVKVPRAMVTLGWTLDDQKSSEVLVEDLNTLHRLDKRIRGMIGTNFLAGFDFLLDYRSRTIDLDDRQAMKNPSGVRIGFEVSEGKMLLSVDLPSFSPEPLRMTVDSGASGLVLFPHRYEPLKTVHSDHDIVAQGTNGSAAVARELTLSSLVIGSFSTHNVPVALFNLGTSRQGREEDGLLPLHLFRSVYFCNSEKFLILN